MLHQLLSIIALMALAMAAFGIGRPLVRGLRLEEDDRLPTVVWSFALGLIAAGLFLASMGLMGLLYRPLIIALTFCGCGWGIREMLRSRFDEEPEPEDDEESLDSGPLPWLVWAVAAGACIACLGSLVGALAPPTAGDALCYHLELPKRFLLEGELVYLPYSDNATFPLLTEMWYLWALALDGGVCAQLVHWASGLLLAGAAVVLAGPIIGRRWAYLPGALVLLTPGINNQMTAPLNDVALAAMTTLALAAWWRAVFEDRGRQWLLAAGLAGGAAMATKYIALVFAASVGLTWVWLAVRQPRHRRLLVEGTAVVAVLAVSVAGLWYVRAAWHRGNPVYPFLSEAVGDSEHETLPASKSPLGRSVQGLAYAPWAVTMQPERFGGRGHQLGVLFLAALPGLVFARRLRGLGVLLAVAGVYFVIWYLLRQNVRFLFPIVPLLAVAAAWVWIEMRRLDRWPRLISGAAMAAIVLAFVVVPVARSRDKVRVAFGVEDREDFLFRNEPEYRAAAVANALLKPSDHILSQEYRAFYFNARVTRENIYRRTERYDELLDRPSELFDYLRDAGFTHLLLAETVSDNATAYDPTLSRLVDASGDERFFTLTDHLTADRDGVKRRYRLVMLK